MKKTKQIDLVFLGFLVYFASYVTRINYGAVISEITASEGIPKTAASAAVTCSFITYGIGQVVSGYAGDKMNPKRLIFFGLFSSSVLNLLLPLNMSVGYECTVWAINGFAQSLIWPPLVRLLAVNLSEEKYQKACVTVSAASSVGTVAVYLLSPAAIALSGWRSVFFFSAAIGLFTAFLWLFASKNIDSFKKETLVQKPSSTATGMKNFIWASGLIPISAAILVQGILRDGITTWTPVYLSENYGLPTTSSIATSVVIPLFGIFSLKLTSLINRKYLRNELTLSALLFLIAGAATQLSAAANQMWLSVLLMPLAVGCMHGINLLLVCQIPGKFAKYGKVSLISGAMNFFTYVGSALSTYGIAKIAENTSWTGALTAYSVVAAVGLLLCFFQKRHWAVFSENSSENTKT